MSTIEIVGYVGSISVAISMVMSSIVKFRWINLFGAATFLTYGFLIEAIPVVLLNGFIVAVDIFFLTRIYTKKHLFDILEVNNDNRYLQKFIEHNAVDIKKFFPQFSNEPGKETVSFFVLRNINVTGLFIAHKKENGEALHVDLDYVIPNYRDYKNGRYVYHRISHYLKSNGYKRITATGGEISHRKYLKKVGFTEKKQDIFEKVLNIQK